MVSFLLSDSSEYILSSGGRGEAAPELAATGARVACSGVSHGLPAPARVARIKARMVPE